MTSSHPEGQEALAASGLMGRSVEHSFPGGDIGLAIAAGQEDANHSFPSGLAIAASQEDATAAEEKPPPEMQELVKDHIDEKRKDGTTSFDDLSTEIEQLETRCPLSAATP